MRVSFSGQICNISGLTNYHHSYKMFKFTDIKWLSFLVIGYPFLYIFKTFQNQKKWFYFFFEINTFSSKKDNRITKMITNTKNPFNLSIFTDKFIKNPVILFLFWLSFLDFGYPFLPFHFLFLKIWKSFLKKMKINYFSSR